MKKIALPILAGFIATNLFAQAPLTATDLTTTIGTNFKNFNISPQDPGEGGMDQTWDFSNSLVLAQQSVEIQDLESTGVELNFPDANVQFVRNFGVSSVFYAIDSDTYSYLGEYEDGGYQEIYSDPKIYINFPAAVGDNFQDSYIYHAEESTGSGDVEGDFDAEVDGVGTLILSWGEVQNAYRISATETYTILFNTGVTTYEGEYSGTSTQWYAAGYPGPLVTIIHGTISVPELNNQADINTTSYLGDFTFVGIDEKEIVEGLRLWPMPASDELNITFENPGGDPIQIMLFDVSGKKLRSWTPKQSGGNKFLSKIDISNLPPGFYLLQLQSEKGTQSRKIVVK